MAENTMNIGFNSSYMTEAMSSIDAVNVQIRFFYINKGSYNQTHSRGRKGRNPKIPTIIGHDIYTRDAAEIELSNAS